MMTFIKYYNYNIMIYFLSCKIIYTVYPQILAVIKFGDLHEIWPKCINLLAEFKFGGSAFHHRYVSDCRIIITYTPYIITYTYSRSVYYYKNIIRLHVINSDLN